jgi:hypothetical protein
MPFHDFDLLCKFIDQREEEIQRQQAEMRSH